MINDNTSEDLTEMTTAFVIDKMKVNYPLVLVPLPMLQRSSLFTASDLSQMMTSQIATQDLYAHCFRGEMKT